jgi:hypothetical protein
MVRPLQSNIFLLAVVLVAQPMWAEVEELAVFYLTQQHFLLVLLMELLLVLVDQVALKI